MRIILRRSSHSFCLHREGGLELMKIISGTFRWNSKCDLHNAENMSSRYAATHWRLFIKCFTIANPDATDMHIANQLAPPDKCRNMPWNSPLQKLSCPAYTFDVALTFKRIYELVLKVDRLSWQTDFDIDWDENIPCELAEK